MKNIFLAVFILITINNVFSKIPPAFNPRKDYKTQLNKLVAHYYEKMRPLFQTALDHYKKIYKIKKTTRLRKHLFKLDMIRDKDILSVLIMEQPNYIFLMNQQSAYVISTTTELKKGDDSKKIYLSFDLIKKKIVAISMFHNLELVDPIDNEVSISRKIKKLQENNPSELKNIVKIIDVARDHLGQHYIISEYVPESFSRNAKTLSLKAREMSDMGKLMVIRDALKGVKALHKNGISQGDFHIGNIRYYLNKDNPKLPSKVKLIDFDNAYTFGFTDDEMELVMKTILWEPNRVGNELKLIFPFIKNTKSLSLKKDMSDKSHPTQMFFLTLKMLETTMSVQRIIELLDLIINMLKDYPDHDFPENKKNR